MDFVSSLRPPQAMERRCEVVNSVRASFLFRSLHPTLSLRRVFEPRERVGVRVPWTRTSIRKNSAVNQRAAGLSPLSKKRNRLEASNVGERICHAKLSPAKTR